MGKEWAMPTSSYKPSPRSSLRKGKEGKVLGEGAEKTFWE